MLSEWKASHIKSIGAGTLSLLRNEAGQIYPHRCNDDCKAPGLGSPLHRVGGSQPKGATQSG